MTKTLPEHALPRGDRVLVRPVQADTITPEGLHIPEEATDKPTEAIVVAVGPGRVLDNGERIAVQVRESDRVAFTDYSGFEIKLNNETLMIVRESDIHAIVVRPGQESS